MVYTRTSTSDGSESHTKTRARHQRPNYSQVSQDPRVYQSVSKVKESHLAHELQESTYLELESRTQRAVDSIPIGNNCPKGKEAYRTSSDYLASAYHIVNNRQEDRSTCSSIR